MFILYGILLFVRSEENKKQIKQGWIKIDACFCDSLWNNSTFRVNHLGTEYASE